MDILNYALSKQMVAAHNTSETAHAEHVSYLLHRIFDIRADLAAEHLNTEKRLAPLEAFAKTLDTLNPHGEDTVTATTATGEATLPKNAADGKLGLTVKGVTDGTKHSLPAKITAKDADGNTVSEAFTPNVVMRSVPDGVADEYNVNTGIFTQRIDTDETPLAEPIIAQYPPQYPKCKGGGSLTVENILGDADFYGVGVTVEGLTFSEIMRVTKIDLENGLETDVTDTCTLNEDKDGFTSTELAAGDICWYELRIDPATTTIPPVDYTYYDSRFVAVDDTDNKMYRWKVVTTNGVARIETEEIV